jgi:hypothetical protein
MTQKYDPDFHANTDRINQALEAYIQAEENRDAEQQAAEKLQGRLGLFGRHGPVWGPVGVIGFPIVFAPLYSPIATALASSALAPVVAAGLVMAFAAWRLGRNRQKTREQIEEHQTRAKGFERTMTANKVIAGNAMGSEELTRRGQEELEQFNIQDQQTSSERLQKLAEKFPENGGLFRAIQDHAQKPPEPGRGIT